jgi:acetylglutamate kinase
MTRYNHPPVLIKIGGHELTDAKFLNDLAMVIRDYPAPVVIVHGGGAEITDMQERLHIEPRKMDGVRITDQATLDVVVMMLRGLVNTRLVQILTEAGVDAIGVSGVDRGLIRAVKMRHTYIDMGFTGEVVKVKGDIIRGWLHEGVVPVISPICMGGDPVMVAPQAIYNVNADHVAGAVANAIHAEKIIFLTNVAGVLVDGMVQDHLNTKQTNQLIENGTIHGGMIPKVKTALHVVELGVPKAVITNLDGLKTNTGTTFSGAKLK